MSALLRCAALDIAVHECVLVDKLTLELPPRSVTCVLGRNGTGKSLTLHTLAGLRAFISGQLWLRERELATYTRREIAQQLAFVAQDIDEPFPVTALEYAVSGSHPHIGFWQWESPRDYQLAQAALEAVDLKLFAQRRIDTLSGGERRRLAIAAALTQAPHVFVLDEPTNHLDPQHQVQLLKLLRSTADAGGTVIMSLHDPGLAARFADYALLWYGDGQWQHGPVDDVLTAATLSRLYRTPIQELRWDGGKAFVGA